MNIVIVGHVCIDTNTTEHATYTSWGSSALYIATYLSHRSDVVVVAKYGSDILPLLPEVKMLPEKPTQNKTLLYENDTCAVPRIWKAHQIEFAGEPEVSPKVIDALQQADVVFVATLLPNYSAKYLSNLLSHAKADALKVLCPQGYFRHVNDENLVVPREFIEADEIVPQFDLIIYSEEDHPKALEIAQEWKKHGPDVQIVITQGPEGANIVEQNRVVHIPTTPLSPDEIVDSVGCGDVFAATVAYEYKQSGNLEQAVKAAHKAAAKKLQTTPLEQSGK